MEKNYERALPDFLVTSDSIFVIITDLEGKYVYYNKYFTCSFCPEGKSLINLPFSLTIHHEDVNQGIEAAIKCIENKESKQKVVLRKPGLTNNDFFWTQWEFSYFKGDQVLPDGILCVGYDISSESKTKSELQLSENKLRAILDSSSDGNILISPDLKVLSFNKAAQKNTSELLGKELLEGDDFRNYVVPGTEAGFYKDFNRALQGESISFDMEIPFHENKIWFRILYNPVYDKKNTLIGVTFSAQYIDSEKRVELKMFENEEKFRKTLEVAPVMVAIIDSSKKITYVNPMLEKGLGYERDELIHHDLNVLIPDHLHSMHEKMVNGYYEKPLLISKLRNDIIYAKRKNNSHLEVEVYLNHYKIQDELYVVAIMHDVSLLRKSEQKLKENNEQLKKIAWRQSHEVRGPLANILGLCNLLESASGDSEHEQLLSFLKVSASRLDDIINQIVQETYRM
ncbi:MAG: PAS domain S-box protein [Cyclobacteriaceae bacterium]|nr:PAS domain S-box protein [Cyclobacteriaceae bacterium]